tara:strand:- start:1917 stop:2192 length:276 start_codon:yes stop_codon:yes gene_type:complete
MINNLIGFFGGFLVSSIIDSTLGEFGEWAIVGGGLVIATLEAFSNFYYTFLRKFQGAVGEEYAFLNLLLVVNYFKVGIIYGLIVDAFKLGS